ncbi:MAG: 23S rRNA (guanosine(2251)-2'-O)-methyltransferase RlmB [Candidatus Enteromonas sp.]|nr:23S rRNA (guanosine(2251)-2'-O)-methyltransferase RlmB [bacterium]MDD6917696.1 23S rRNA (guanosine(2251)-2'-O)-methyltransferase RlmB [bacterium]MDY6100875.1 23S rRNA (guanosine(2251)-2'-O)-methyltransferase RlmB [Candidatus Enteromonas sp.]
MSIIIYGKNAVREAVASGCATGLKVVKRFEQDMIVQQAKAKKIPVELVEEPELTRIAKNPSHQGFLAICKGWKNYTIEELIESSKRSAYPLLLILDGIEDPHNLGAILRSCDAFGIDGIIMKKRNEVPLNSTVAKVSTGAICYEKVASVPNLSQAIRKLKDNGFWVVTSDGSGTTNYDEIDYKCPIALVVGSEGFGVSRLLVRDSDFVAKIPMVGHVNSLNASVATAVFLAQISSSRSH